MSLKHFIPGILLIGAFTWALADDEPYTAKYQSTYNTQYHPQFNEAYAGPNSLTHQADSMFTLSMTAHWGMRIEPDTELYFNPEVMSGIPFANNLIGLGGFTNGEITRAAGSTPQLYRQRLFLRKIWNQGGGTENVESDFNQLAGSVDKNRSVMTLGNFSILDVFDQNAYAKDPRTQFMNWGNWTYAAWDYAADARGYGWGITYEIYQGDWVYKLGRMTGPKVPNGLAIDFNILNHYGDQFEIEHAHNIHHLPGKVRVLFYRNRAVLASFNDATAYLLNDHPADAQTILDVRNGEKIKYGFGINLEQALSQDTGFYLRAMKSDGKTETYAFTEVDSSISTGLIFQGQQWHRPEDSAGLSFMVNYLSADRRRYLENGGISFFIGDGQLQYKPETIFEGFYSLHLTHDAWLTGDYQRIQNPAFNAARGPVSVYGLRLHLEF